MNGATLGIMVLIGAAIGYVTNVLAIRLLFRPFEPVGIGVFQLQGLIPKRRREIAKNIGEVVAQELVSMEEIIDRFLENVDKTQMLLLLKNRLRTLASEKMPFFLPQQMREMILTQLDTIIDEEGEDLLVEMTENLVHRATAAVDLAAMIEEKINGFDLARIEKILLAIAKKELRHIEWIGGLLGGVIGFVQGLFVLGIYR